MAPVIEQREEVRKLRTRFSRQPRRLHVIRNVMAPELRNPRDPRVVSYDPNAKACQLPKPPEVAPSRTLDLRSDRAVDKFIRQVLETRSRLAERDRWRSRMLPALAGGAENPGAASGQGAASQPATEAQPIVPFDQASKRGIEPGPQFVVTPGAGSTTLGPVPLPAQGYLRAVEIDVATSTAGTGAGAELSQDFPTNILQLIRFQDTNGNQLDDLPGFALGEDNIYGGYAGSPDFRVDPDFSAAALTPSFQLMIVRELAPNGFGSIANMSASQAYKLTLRVATAAEIYKKAPAETNPTLTISVWMHFWQLPDAEDMMKRPQVQTPPFHGTTQYRWYAPANSVTQNFNLKITQTGNEIRLMNLIGRTAAGARSWAVFPEPFQFRWDTELLVIAGLRQLRKIARELTNDQVAVDVGVLPLPFNFGEGRMVGGSGVNSWLPTVTSTRLEITGAQAASTPGTVDVYTNDVSVAETNPALRPVSPGPGGYTAPVAPRLAHAA